MHTSPNSSQSPLTPAITGEAKLRSRLSRRQFLAGLLTAGAATAGAELIRRSVNNPARPTTSTNPTVLFATPLQQIVVVIRENHSYDNIFGLYPRGNGVPPGTVIDHCPDMMRQDPPHNHSDAVAALSTEGAATAEARCVYHQEDVPGYYSLADTFTLCDNFYTEILGATIPNQFSLIASWPGLASFPFSPQTCPITCFNVPTLPDRAVSAGLSWRLYSQTAYDVTRMIQNLHSNPNDVPSSQFLIDAAAGTLPNVSWLQVDDPYAEHPPDSETAGQDWMMLQVNGLMASPQWPTSAMLIVWDDWGGFYDHVLPPNVATTSSFEDQYRLGFRTGCLVISPYAKPGYISSTLYSFSSILALIEAVYNLEPLTALDRFANNMLDCFDFEQRPLPPRPAPLVGTLEREGYVGSGEPDDDEVLP